MKVLPVSWYDGLARILTKVEDVGVWPDGLLDAYITMILKTEEHLGRSPFSRKKVTIFIGRETKTHI